MADSSVPNEVRERVLRGLSLFRERGEEIQPRSHGRYGVPASGREDAYTVDLGIMSGVQGCTCPDFQRHREEIGTCKHLIAAELYRCKIQMPRIRRRREATLRSKGVALVGAS